MMINVPFQVVFAGRARVEAISREHAEELLLGGVTILGGLYEGCRVINTSPSVRTWHVGDTASIRPAGKEEDRPRGLKGMVCLHYITTPAADGMKEEVFQYCLLDKAGHGVAYVTLRQSFGAPRVLRGKIMDQPDFRVVRSLQAHEDALLRCAQRALRKSTPLQL